MSDINYQTKISSSLQICSGILSTIGSSLIIYVIRSNRGNKQSMYYRLMMGLSIVDLFTSLAYAVNSLASPVGTPNTWFAYGNQVTCVIQGVFFQIGLAVMFYNSALMLYFVLRIRYQKPESWLQDNIERSIHIIIILIAVVPSIIGIRLGVFNNIGVICYVAAYPRGCDLTDTISCDRGEYAKEFLWSTSLSWFIVNFIWLCVSVVIVWRTVQKNEQRMMQKYNFAVTSSNCHARISITEDNRTPKRHQNVLTKTIEIRNQAIRYVIIFFLCYFWSFLLQVKIIRNPRLLEFVRYASSFFHPLQGFLNLFNFVFLRVKRIRRRQNARNIFYALYLVIFKTETELKQRQMRKRSYRFNRDRIPAPEINLQ